MIRIVLGAAAIAAVVASPAMAQSCYYDWYGRAVCMQAPAPQYPAQAPQIDPLKPWDLAGCPPRCNRGWGHMTRDPGPSSILAGGEGAASTSVRGIDKALAVPRGD
jgi:hypothetical protein